ncbi:hypothetical protein GLOTRDRAFT_51519 [Gloeophyllum trabeum ATCC 11539]|uniref:DUF6532 domain-containing protein n=1 Tax=Gloeophyllum trabeum (strain ATCC 11539 / FP-39264 / Madison 617) TaxID=670483 RepID=S7RBS3_GLOTA|nr:uncharacterized protein GLOTRDRAFT_51519 [Gloeophyllum trabeum ATCC 11539]EPQ49844.1 hypothetical protein GLOTRDRAFT_51519 [Gloeophyllum trabeum ATCC 11539]
MPPPLPRNPHEAIPNPRNEYPRPPTPRPSRARGLGDGVAADTVVHQPLFYTDGEDDEQRDGSLDDHREVDGADAAVLPRGQTRGAPAQTTSATTRLTKTRKLTGSAGSRGRIGLSQFGPVLRSVISLAQYIYRCKIMTEWPYPNDVEEQGMAMEAWTAACKAKNLHVEFDEDALKLITTRASQVRGELKTKARPLAAYEYNLREGKGQDGVRALRDKVEALLDGSTFVFKDPVGRTGLYQHPIIQALINEMWFANKKDEGIVHSEFFSPRIPLVTIAMVLTAIQCSLEEWQTGQKTDIPFTETAYSSHFENHLRALEQFHQKTKDLKIMPQIQMKLRRKARAYAKADDEEQSGSREIFEDADVEAARREFEEGGVSDDE